MASTTTQTSQAPIRQNTVYSEAPAMVQRAPLHTPQVVQLQDRVEAADIPLMASTTTQTSQAPIRQNTLYSEAPAIVQAAPSSKK
jgi:hypothetical protein